MNGDPEAPAGSSPARQRVLAGALAVVDERGLAGLTTRAVADRIGLTQPALYRHFASKEELVEAVLRRIGREFRAQVDEAARDRTPPVALRSALGAFRTFAVEHAHRYDTLFLRPPGRSGLSANPGSVFSRLVDIVGACIEDGFLSEDDPEELALTLAGMVRGLVGLYRRGRFESPAAFEAFYERSLDRVFRGIGPRP